MDEPRYFVVRSAGIRYSIENGRQRGTDHERARPHEYGARIEYEAEVPASMTLKEAIRLYESGVRAKLRPPEKKATLILADVLAEKRAWRAAK